MTNRSLPRSLPCALALLALGGCLQGQKVVVQPEVCCNGIRCSNGIVGAVSPGQDTGEGDNPCMSCHIDALGTCVDGCGSSVNWGIQGCAMGYACKTWDRVGIGATCTTDRDCEPGVVDGKNANTLYCRQGKCVDAGVNKWAATVVPTVCSGDPLYGAHPDCNGGACLTVDNYSVTRYCSVAKCIGDADCPAGWHCRCDEELVGTGYRAWRWCVPTLATADGG